MWCWHKWSRWADPVQTYNSGRKQQWRVCEKCNKATFRTLWWDHQTDLTAALNSIKRIVPLVEKGES